MNDDKTPIDKMWEAANSDRADAGSFAIAYALLRIRAELREIGGAISRRPLSPLVEAALRQRGE